MHFTLLLWGSLEGHKYQIISSTSGKSYPIETKCQRSHLCRIMPFLEIARTTCSHSHPLRFLPRRFTPINPCKPCCFLIPCWVANPLLLHSQRFPSDQGR